MTKRILRIMRGYHLDKNDPKHCGNCKWMVLLRSSHPDDWAKPTIRRCGLHGPRVSECGRCYDWKRSDKVEQ